MKQFDEEKFVGGVESPSVESMDIDEANAELLKDNLKKIEENHNKIMDQIADISAENAPELLKQTEDLADELEFIQQDNPDSEEIKLMQKKIQSTMDVIKMNA